LSRNSIYIFFYNAIVKKDGSASVFFRYNKIDHLNKFYHPQKKEYNFIINFDTHILFKQSEYIVTYLTQKFN